MNELLKAILAGIARQALGSLGGALASQGLATGDQTKAIIGGVVAALAVIHSIRSKIKAVQKPVINQ
jgi:hypothetical protein